MSALPCAHRCSLVADLCAEVARARGTSERVIRVSLGLTPEYVPLREVCGRCGQVWDLHENRTACEASD